MTEDRGAPASYMTLARGTPVFASDGTRVGTVEHVLADADADIFDGLVIDIRSGPGGHRFVDAPEVARIAERGVTLTIDAAGVEGLHRPSENPAGMTAGPGAGADSRLAHKLRRAWDMISGRY
jgi:PRC-barrel domain